MRGDLDAWLALHLTDRPTEIRRTAGPAVSAPATRATRLPMGHPEGFIEAFANLYREAWRLGVKAVAIYRDNCKVAQPLSKKSDSSGPAISPATLAPAPKRRR